MKSYLKELAGLLRSGAWVLNGLESTSGESLNIFFVGSQKQKTYISSLAYDVQCTERDCGKLYVWRILFMLITNTSGCDVAIIEGGRLHRVLYKNAKDFFLPLWLKTTATIPLPATSHSYKEDIRRIRKSGLSYEVVTEGSKIDDFYHNMYRPAVNASHGESTIEINYDEMIRQWNSGKCELLLISREGISIAGVLVIRNEIPRLWANGVRDNNPGYRKFSVITATYHFAAEYLGGQGYKTMDLGLSRGFLNDGILQFKNKFGHGVIGVDTSGFVLKVLRGGAGSDQFLINNPFLHLRGGLLYGVVFMTRDEELSEKRSAKLQKKYFLEGLAGLHIFQQGNILGSFNNIAEY
jgi:hypothetical protein